MADKRSLFIQLAYIVLFVAINCLLLFHAMPDEEFDHSKRISPTYAHASDGQRYWGVAVNLAESGRFVLRTQSKVSLIDAAKSSNKDRTVIQEPMSRAGPLPALVFSIPIKLLGFEKGAIGIVGIQCIVLFLTGVMARTLVGPFNWNKNVVQALLIFNPNLIGLAHHAQSETIFVFLITGILVFVTKCLTYKQTAKKSEVILFGLCLGLLPLARPLGAYIVIALPIMLVVSMWINRNGFRSCQEYLNYRVVLGVFLVTLLTLSPWAFRNYMVFGQFSLTQSEGIMMQWHYNSLTSYLGPRANEQDPFVKYLSGEDSNECVGDYSLREGKCKQKAAKVYLEAILDSSASDIFYVLMASWSKLFLSGGTTALTRYVGLPTLNLHRIWHKNNNSSVVVRFIQSVLHTEYRGFFIIFLVTTTFAWLTRIFGLIGLFRCTSRTALALTMFYGLSVGVFLMMYLFVGLSRFRAPLEPILMLYATGGICFVAAKFRQAMSSFSQSL